MPDETSVGEFQDESMPTPSYSQLFAFSGDIRFASAPGGSVVYITNGSNSLLRFDTSTGQFLTPIDVGRALGDLSVSPDGAYVYLQQSTASFAQRVDVSTGAISNLTIATGGFNFASRDIATDFLGRIFLTSNYSGDDAGYVFSVSGNELASNTALATPYMGSYPNILLDSSEDGRFILAVENGVGPGGFYIIDVTTDTFLNSHDFLPHGTIGFDRDRNAISAAAGLVAISTYNELIVVDFNMDLRANLSGSSVFGSSYGVTAGLVGGVEFTADGNYLLVWDTAADIIRAFDTFSFDQRATFSLASDIQYVANSSDYGRLFVSSDGQTLFLDAESAIEVVDLTQALVFNLTGTAADDVLFGSVSADTLSGGSGNDTIVGGASGDTLDGGLGVDTLSYRRSQEGVVANLGTRSVSGGDAQGDTVSGFENLEGSSHADSLTGSASDNVIDGGDGDDTINGGDGNDTISGGGGNDFIVGGRGADDIDGGAGNDTIYINSNDTNSLYAETYNGGAGEDTLAFQANATYNLQGVPVSGFERILIQFDSATAPYQTFRILLDGAFFSDSQILYMSSDPHGSEGTYCLIEIEMGQQQSLDLSDMEFDANWNAGTTPNAWRDLIVVTGDDDAETIIGSSQQDFIFGLGGDDVLDAGAGNDEVHGGLGRDHVSAGAGNDWVSVGSGDLNAGEFYDGGAGTDELMIVSNSGAGVLDFRTSTVTGFETMSFEFYLDTTLKFTSSQWFANGLEQISAGRTSSNIVAAATIAIDMSGEAIFDATSVPILTALPGGLSGPVYPMTVNFVLNGSETSETLTGNSGNDVINGNYGGDILDGKAGNDSLFGGDGHFISATEWSVFRLYQAALGRAPDPQGFDNWTRAINAGAVTLLDAMTAFAGSAEFQLRYGSLDNASFVTLLYNNVLGRTPDPAGLSSWVAQLDAGGSRAGVLFGFSESAEFLVRSEFSAQAWTTLNQTVDAEGQLYRLYQATLGRVPDAGGFQYWINLLDGGQTYADIVPGFVNSPEFQARFGNPDNTGFVTLAYQNVLGRDPDSGGLANWVNYLENGGTRIGLIEGFAESQESVNRTAAGLDTFMHTALPGWNDTLIGGAGDDQLFGGRGADTFVFDANDDGSDTVYGLDRSDHLDFQNFGYATTGDVAAHLAQVGSDVVFTDQGVTIVFTASSVADVAAIAGVSSSAQALPGAPEYAAISVDPSLESARPASHKDFFLMSPDDLSDGIDAFAWDTDQPPALDPWQLA